MIPASSSKRARVEQARDVFESFSSSSSSPSPSFPTSTQVPSNASSLPKPTPLHLTAQDIVPLLIEELSQLEFAMVVRPFRPKEGVGRHGGDLWCHGSAVRLPTLPLVVDDFLGDLRRRGLQAGHQGRRWQRDRMVYYSCFQKNQAYRVGPLTLVSKLERTRLDMLHDLYGTFTPKQESPEGLSKALQPRAEPRVGDILVGRTAKSRKVDSSCEATYKYWCDGAEALYVLTCLCLCRGQMHLTRLYELLSQPSRHAFPGKHDFWVAMLLIFAPHHLHHLQEMQDQKVPTTSPTPASMPTLVPTPMPTTGTGPSILQTPVHVSNGLYKFLVQFRCRYISLSKDIPVTHLLSEKLQALVKKEETRGGDMSTSVGVTSFDGILEAWKRQWGAGMNMRRKDPTIKRDQDEIITTFVPSTDIRAQMLGLRAEDMQERTREPPQWSSSSTPPATSPSFMPHSPTSPPPDTSSRLDQLRTSVLHFLSIAPQ